MLPFPTVTRRVLAPCGLISGIVSFWASGLQRGSGWCSWDRYSCSPPREAVDEAAPEP